MFRFEIGCRVVIAPSQCPWARPRCVHPLIWCSCIDSVHDLVLQTMYGLQSRKDAANSIWTGLRKLVFGVLLAMCLDDHAFSLVSTGTVVLEVMQIASFPLSSVAGFPWAAGRHAFTKPLSQLLQVFSATTIEELTSPVRALSE